MTAADWMHDVMRWGHVNFNERDPETFDVPWWTNYWSSCRLQGVTLNAGGSVAYYPTEVPLHRRSRFLGNRDLFGESVAAAKTLDLRVLGRLDPVFVLQELYDAHPDWCMTHEDGTPMTTATAFAIAQVRVDVAEAEPVYLSCHNSPYYRDFLMDVVTEVLQRYPVDGVFTNVWPMVQSGPVTVQSMCHCPHCLKAWHEARPGRERPRRADPSDPDWRDYVGFVMDRVEAVQRRFRAHVAELRPEGTFLSVALPAAGTSLRWDRWIDLIDALVSDAQGRGSYRAGPPAAALWEVGQISELLRSVARGKPVLRSSATYTSPPLLRHVARPPLETRMHMAEIVAHGERPKWHTIGGSPHDRRWMQDVEELFRWLADHERHLRNTRAISDVGVVWSSRSVHLDAWRADPGPAHREALAGWYRALLEARIPFEYVHETDVDALDRFRVVVLPTGLRLDDRGIAALERHRQRGGGIVACCGALARDEWDATRDAQRLEALLGVRYADTVGPLMQPTIDIRNTVELLTGFADTDIIAGGQWLTTFSASARAISEGSWIPDYPANPTHRVVPPASRADVPICATTRDAQTSPAVYLAADFDAAFFRYGHPDHGELLQRAIEVAMDGAQFRVEVRGRGFVDVRAWRQRSSITVFLVNLDNPMLNVGPVRELRDIGPFEVELHLGEECPSTVRLLRHDQPCAAWRVEAQRLVATVPTVHDFEVLAIDLEHDDTGRPSATSSSTVRNRRAS